jgi:hypothetical protein
VSRRRRLGATGHFPDGHLTAADEGEIAIAVGRHDGNVVIEFGKSTKWVGFPPRQAREIAALLLKHAEAIEN